MDHIWNDWLNIRGLINSGVLIELCFIVMRIIKILSQNCDQGNRFLYYGRTLLITVQGWVSCQRIALSHNVTHWPVLQSHSLILPECSPVASRVQLLLFNLFHDWVLSCRLWLAPNATDQTCSLQSSRYMGRCGFSSWSPSSSSSTSSIMMFSLSPCVEPFEYCLALLQLQRENVFFLYYDIKISKSKQ